MGMDSISTISEKVEDNNFKDDLLFQYDKYNEILNRVNSELKNYDEVVYNQDDKSYTMKLSLNVSETIMAAFKVAATLELVTKDGQIKSVESGEEGLNQLTFYPAEYILDEVSVKGLINGRKNFHFFVYK